ncbi:phosphatase PAP2 family protein, partial [Phaeospirillum tilakii]
MVDEAVWRLISGFGDSGVILPLVSAVALCLAWGGGGRIALALLLPVAGCGGGVAGLKLLFGACGGAVAGLAQASPSGHVAMSLAAYGGLALLLARGETPARRGMAAAAAALLVGLIALSRVRLGAHSPGEVLAGLGPGHA